MESPYGININSEMGDDSKNSGNLLIRENIASDDIDNTYLQYILEIPLQLNDELEDNEGLKEFQSLFYWKCFCNGHKKMTYFSIDCLYVSLFREFL